MSYKAEVLVAGEKDWVPNGLCFATEKEADDYALDLASRWMAVRETRAVSSTEPVNYTYENGKLKELTAVS